MRKTDTKKSENGKIKTNLKSLQEEKTKQQKLKSKSGTPASTT